MVAVLGKGPTVKGTNGKGDAGLHALGLHKVRDLILLGISYDATNTIGHSGKGSAVTDPRSIFTKTPQSPRPRSDPEKGSQAGSDTAYACAPYRAVPGHTDHIREAAEYGGKSS